MKTFLIRLIQTFNNPLVLSLFQHKFSHDSFSASEGKDAAIDLLSAL